ncbi:MAG: hypothetical protein EOO46_21735 [Flavobacterium sp.]|nr:MAG: hypothetical protein EOO46_21735 [Flavobacterium sp.]
MNNVVKVFEEHSSNPHWIFISKQASDDTRSVVLENKFDWQYPDPLIFALGSLAKGTTRGFIARRYGESAHKRIDAMLEAGLLKEINNRIALPSGLHLSDVRDVLANIKIHVHSWSVEALETGGFYHHKKDGISFEGRAHIKEATRKWLMEVVELKEKFKGSDCAMVLSLVTSFIEEGRE